MHGSDLRLLTVSEAAKLIGVSKSFMDQRRLRGNGAPYRKIGRRVFYDLQDLKDWISSQRRLNTSEI